VTTSLLYRFAYTNILCGHYSSGLRFARRAEEEARRAGLLFASTHITAAKIGAMIGLRQLRRAQNALTNLHDTLPVDDPFEVLNANALLARLSLSGGNLKQAAESVVSWRRAPTPSLRGECAALRAVALASDGQADEAAELAEHASSVTTEAQAQTLASIAHAINAIKHSSNSSESTLEWLEQVLIERESWDNFVCGYRACPELLGTIAKRRVVPAERLVELVSEARDSRIGDRFGIPAPIIKRYAPELSAREREVYQLLCEGLTNREIAQTLVISVVTVKVHVRHILEKVGARSRTEAVLKLFETQ
jgi:DNA-binding NarL/FixJ family response regulator